MSTAANSVLSITQRLTQAQQQWAQAIKAHDRTIRCAMPGIIVAVDLAGEQTVTVQLAVNEEIVLPDGTVSKQPIAQLIHVPLVLPRAGGFSVTLPVKAGDECLVVFGDMAIDNWWASGASGALTTPPSLPDQIEIRRHDLSDGFAVLGTWSQPRRLTNYSASSMQLRSDDGQTVVDIAEGQVTITSPQIQATSPMINMGASGGPVLALATSAFLTWFTTDILPFLATKGYTGPAPPANSITTVLKAE